MSDRMKDADEARVNRAQTNLEEILNLHGYGFQEAVKERAIALQPDYDKGNPEWGWKYFGSEIPVALHDSHTHVDLILRAWTKRRNRHTGYFLVGECKRVNPSKGYWCFVKRRNTWPEQTDGTIQFDCLEATGGPTSPFTAMTSSALVQEMVFDLGVEVKTDQKGDPCTSPDKSPIQAAVGQVLRSVGGFIDTINSSIAFNDILEVGKPEIMIPVVFTTAELFASNVDLGSSGLGDGKLEKITGNLTRVPWVWFNYHRTANLRAKRRFGYGDKRSNMSANAIEMLYGRL